MNDKILLQNMMFYGYHGVYEYEREQGQKFYVDVELYMDSKQACDTDDLQQTVDYVAAYFQIKTIFETKKFNLMEALADHIGKTLLQGLISKVVVRVRKPGAPLPGEFDYVQFETTVCREI